MRFRVIVDGSPSSPELEFGPLPTDGLCDGGVRRPDGSLAFGAEADVVETGGRARLRGPMIHGPASAPFLYLSVRRPGIGSWLYRMKVPLPTDGLRDRELAVRIAATGGGTVKLPPGGWTSTDR